MHTRTNPKGRIPDALKLIKEHLRDPDLSPSRVAGESGLELRELPERDSCCGFGGTFCVKYPDISQRLVDDKVDAVQASGADTLLAADLGCLLNIAGRLRRRGVPVHVFHIAEVLADMASGPGIGGDGAA